MQSQSKQRNVPSAPNLPAGHHRQHGTPYYDLAAFRFRGAAFFFAVVFFALAWELLAASCLRSSSYFWSISRSKFPDG